MGALDLAQNRYRLLVKQLRAAGKTQGEIGELFGVTQATISNHETGALGAKIETICTAIDSLHLRPDFFFDPGLGALPRWELYVDRASRPLSVPDDPPGWLKFVSEGFLDLFRSKGLDDDQVAMLRAAPFRGGPPRDPEPYVQIARALVGGGAERPPGATKAKEDQASGGKIRRIKP